MKPLNILWFRRDLRIKDNHLLSLPDSKIPVFPIFIFDKNILDDLSKDDRRVSFLFDAVLHLKKSLQSIGLDLALFYGEVSQVFDYVQKQFKQPITTIYANVDYDSYAKERDKKISDKYHFYPLYDSYIFQPSQFLKENGTPYLVFTAFYNRLKKDFDPLYTKVIQTKQYTKVPFDYSNLYNVNQKKSVSISLQNIGFQKTSYSNKPLSELLNDLEWTVSQYSVNRDKIDCQGTSNLSVHLRFGTLGLREILQKLIEFKNKDIDTEPFFRQLCFRDFYAYLLYHFPHLQIQNFKYSFTGIPNHSLYKKFIQTKTNIPIIDAGISELIQTGRMHNRVRMICASFFTKHLLLPWQWGERFFKIHLMDYDASSNILSWQWCSGTGVDPQPYFRIFNPYLQSAKYDPKARYIKRWLPYLTNIDEKLLHNEKYLFSDSYPYNPPIVLHKESTQKAKIYFKKMQEKTSSNGRFSRVETTVYKKPKINS